MGEHGSVRSSIASDTEKKLPDLPEEAGSPDLRQRIRQTCIHLWIWEMLSLFLCSSCVGAIIIILLRYDGKQLPDWQYGLTINGVISVLSGIAKASMILPVAESISQLKWHWYWNGRSRPVIDFEYFDIASRGPWGCLILLCRPRQWSVATIGAAVTVLALLMEPSLQFIPTYPMHSVVTSTASVSRSTYYNDVFVGESPDRSNDNATIPQYILGSATKNSFRNAIFGSLDKTATPSCPSGNCTWNDFSTLGVCSSCTNLTTTLVYGVLPGASNDYKSWMLSNDVNWSPYNYLVLNMAGRQGDSTTSIVYNRTTDQTILDFYYWQSERTADIFSDLKPKVYECVLFFCIKTYSAAVESGRYTENVTTTWPDPHYKFEKFPDFSSVNEVTGPGSFGIKNATMALPETRNRYNIDSFTFSLLRNWLYWLLLRTSMSSYNDMGENLQDVGEAIYAIQREGDDTVDGGAANRVAGRMADSLTLAIRGLAKEDTAARGDALENRTFVRARWYFAILPIVLVVCTLFFMTITLAITVRQGVPVWKSSALATLAHGLQDDARVSIMADKLDVIEHKASGQSMTLRSSSRQHWRFEGSQTGRSSCA